MNFKQLTLFIALFFGVTGLFQTKGQQSDTLRLDLNTALQIALSESPSIRVAEMEIQRVDYSKQAAWNNILPSLSASGQYAHYLRPGTMSIGGMVIEMPTQFNATMGLNLSLPLFVPALWHSIKMTELDMQLAVERAMASRVQLRSDVTKAFYGVLLAQDSHASLMTAYSLAKDAFEQANKRFELGLGSEFDAISAQVQMTNLQPTILDVEMGINQTIMMLQILMGMETAQPIKIIGNLADYKADISNVGNLFDLSMNNNSDLRQLDIQEQQLQRALMIQRTQKLPTLVAFGSYTYAGTGNKAGNNPFTGQPMDATRDWFSQGLLGGVQLNIPLSGIFTNRANERQTQNQIQQLATQRNALEQSLNLQVQTALNNMERAVQQAEAARGNQDMAQRGYEIALKRYEVGAGVFIETQNALQQLTQAQLSYHQAIANYLNSKADLERTLGYSFR
ncbi:MAG: TolC family protein [Dysgonamonadaceae bacterium]|jgi:outer membrane protein TolC|nr:TolC family protein [Dysgonamonadaceae bacterium]